MMNRRATIEKRKESRNTYHTLDTSPESNSPQELTSTSSRNKLSLRGIHIVLIEFLLFLLRIVI
jgi:hypothetical protein